MDPFKIDGPTCISFSGGRTSAYMLWRALQANAGLPADARVCFANTGLEAEETLEFVRDCATRWGVPIAWLEYRNEGYGLVSFDTAAREGEPFEALIRKRSYLPNPVTRFCTQELKIRPIARYLLDQGFDMTKTEAENASWVGIRADEQRRAAKIKDKGRLPLWAAGVSVQEVNAFWKEQPFDLRLSTFNGRTMEGNCVYCFNKPPAQRLSIARAGRYPIGWWVRAEDGSLVAGATGQGARFTKDGPSYAQIAQYAEDQTEMFDPNEEAIPCFCGD